MTKRLFQLLVTVGFIFFVNPSIAMAEEITPINELLKQATAGDVIQLENHIYEEDVVIDKPVTLKGAKKTVIKGSQSGDVVTLSHDGIILENIKIINSGSVLDHDHAGIKILSNNNKVIGNTIENSLHGIYMEESKENELIGNTISGNLDLNQSRRGNGIHLFHSLGNMIKENIIHNARDGIYFSFAENNQIEHNQISNTRYGVHYMYSDYNDFYQNDFFENVGGVAIMYSDYITLKENRFYDHHDLQSFGVLLQTANQVEMENNQIHFNQKGIFMDQSNRNVFKNNHITNNRIGLDVWTSSSNNTFTGNHILNNNLQYITNGGRDSNTWSEDGIGNAWSGNLFVDLNQDGIGDNPYQYTSAYGAVLAEQPLGSLFLDSPALALYEKWHQLFLSNDQTMEDPSPINKTSQIGGSLFIVIIISFAIAMFWVIKKWWKRL